MFSRIAMMACLIFAFAGSPVNAAQEIGQAVTAKNIVNGKRGPSVRKIRTGNDVWANEIISTGASSATLLKFLDNSNLNVGASSTVILDNFVFNPNGSAKSVVMNLTKGAMRFVSGRSEPRNFKINTQVATLGVRGTDFVTICRQSACAVVVASGRVSVCPHPCRKSYQVDAVQNFTIINRGGRYTVKSLPRSVVAKIISAVANGRNGLTITSIESGTFGGLPIRADSGNGGGSSSKRVSTGGGSGGGGKGVVVTAGGGSGSGGGGGPVVDDGDGGPAVDHGGKGKCGGGNCGKGNGRGGGNGTGNEGHGKGNSKGKGKG